MEENSSHAKQESECCDNEEQEEGEIWQVQDPSTQCRHICKTHIGGSSSTLVRFPARRPDLHFWWYKSRLKTTQQKHPPEILSSHLGNSSFRAFSMWQPVPLSGQPGGGAWDGGSEHLLRALKHEHPCLDVPTIHETHACWNNEILWSLVLGKAIFSQSCQCRHWQMTSSRD